MASIDSKDVESLKSAIDAAEAGLKLTDKQISSLKKSAIDFELSVRRSAARMVSHAQALQDDNKTIISHIQNSKALNKTIDQEIAQIRKNSESSEELRDQLEKLNSKFSHLDEATQNEIRSKILWANRTAATTELFNKTLQSLSPAFAQVSKAGKAILNDYQNDSKGIGGSAAVLEAGLNIAGSTAQMAGKGLSGVGSALMPLGPIGLGVGLGLSAFGGALNLAGGVAKEVADKVLPFLKTELENNIRSFQSLTASGALFGNGISGMIKTAGDAGLTLVQFDRVVKDNKESLATLGGVGAGAIALSNNLKKANETVPGFKNQMLNLGFGFEEQAGLMATVMSNMQRMGRTADSGLIATATADYARNLRVIANITGEDAKKKEEEVRQQSAQVEFRRKLMEIEKDHPGASQRILQQMQMLTPQMQKNVMEQMVLGQTVNETGALLESQSGSFRDGVKGFVDAAKSGMTDQEGTQVLIGKAMDGFKNELGSGQFAGLGRAGMAGHLGDLNKALSDTILYSDKVTEANVRASQAAAAAQQQTTDAQTVAANQVIDVNQRMALEIQKQILDSNVMGVYAKSVAAATNAMLDMVKKFTGGSAADVEAERKRAAEVAARSKSVSAAASQIQGTEAEIKAGGAVAVPAAALATRQATDEERKAFIADKTKGNMTFPDWKKKRDAEKAASTAPVEPTPTVAPVTPPVAPPVAPVAPTAPPPVAPPPVTPSKPSATLPKSFTGPGKIDPETNQWVPYTLAAQPKYNPATITPPGGVVATPNNPLSSATPTPDSVLGNNGAAPAAQQKTAASGSIGDDKMITTAKATADNNKELLEALRKLTASNEEINDSMREVARYSRTTAEAMT